MHYRLHLLVVQEPGGIVQILSLWIRIGSRITDNDGYTGCM